jgi:hypothetical protein
MSRRLDYTDDLRSVIIGEAGTLYKFYTRHPGFDFVEYLATGVFGTDAEAEAWVKAHYPDAYRHGIEMRVYDQ